MIEDLQPITGSSDPTSRKMVRTSRNYRTATVLADRGLVSFRISQTCLGTKFWYIELTEKGMSTNV
jgi:hypothetical protein